MTNHGFSWKRLGRLALKECRESLRDRRTIVTLILMPILLYPLLTIAFQQFLAAGAAGLDTTALRFGFENEAEAQMAVNLLSQGKPPTHSGIDGAEWKIDPKNQLRYIVNPKVKELLEAGEIDAWIRINTIDLMEQANGKKRENPNPNAERFQTQLWEMVVVQGAPNAMRAADYMERWANFAIQVVQLRQGVIPVAVVRRAPIKAPESGGERFSLAALIPLILVLMTITGAVYPAIDLTAGERERGTLELLVAAPASRFLILVAKYCAVLVVALMTATVNLVAMGVTMGATGLGQALFGKNGISLVTLAEIFGLQILFAAFFSALLLAITSFARSFKEAQAYLIPLMLVSLSPGFASLMPGVTLNGPLQVVPLMNIVLLARDLLNGQAQTATTAIVVATTLLYAAAALALAARTFGAEAVLNAEQGAWSDLWRKPPESQIAAPASAALFATAIAFPSYLLLGGFVQQLGEWPIQIRLLVAATAQALVFMALPLLFLSLRNVRMSTGLALKPPNWIFPIAAVLLGLSLWPFGHELALISRQMGISSFSDEALERFQKANEQLRSSSHPLFLFAAFALLPAISEELFFRGFLFSGLRRAFSPTATIWTTALIFGAFHLVTPNAIVVERFLPTALLGVVLAWLRWRSGSLWPGMLLHVCHNGLLIMLFSFEKQLIANGWGVQDEQHLSWTILGTALAVAVVGGLIVQRKAVSLS